MNLHRQIAVAIEVLEEQRKPALRSMTTQQLVAPCCHQLVQRCSRKRTIGYDGLSLLVVGDFPALRVIFAEVDWLAQNAPQTPAAPQIAFEKGLKLQWIKRRGHWVSDLLRRTIAKTNSHHSKLSSPWPIVSIKRADGDWVK